MSLSIGRIITVNISRQASTVARAGFGVGLIMGAAAVSLFGATEYVREYASADAMLTDGFIATDPEYLAVLAYFSQSQKPARVLVGKYSPVATVKEITYAGALTAGTVSVEVFDTVYSEAFAVSQDATMTALAAAIQANARVATCAWNNATQVLTITSIAGVDVSIGAVGVADFTSAAIGLGTQPASGFATALTNIRNDNDDWFMLCLASYGYADALAAMATIEALSRMHCLTVYDRQAAISAGDTQNLAYVNQANNYANSFVIYSDVFQQLGAAWMGLCLPFDPGAETWKFKTLGGVTAANLTESQATNLENIKANWYAEIGGVDITSEGVVGSGEFIDIIRLVYWTEARIREGIYTRLTQLPKMPYTDVGFSIVESEIRQVLRQGIANGGYIDDEKLSVTVPKRADISTADAALRILPDVTFYATLAGAVHSVAVQGTVSV
jgi:hypothetical protein